MGINNSEPLSRKFPSPHIVVLRDTIERIKRGEATNAVSGLRHIAEFVASWQLDQDIAEQNINNLWLCADVLLAAPPDDGFSLGGVINTEQLADEEAFVGLIDNTWGLATDKQVANDVFYDLSPRLVNKNGQFSLEEDPEKISPQNMLLFGLNLRILDGLTKEVFMGNMLAARELLVSMNIT